MIPVKDVLDMLQVLAYQVGSAPPVLGKLRFSLTELTVYPVRRVGSDTAHRSAHNGRLSD